MSPCAQDLRSGIDYIQRFGDKFAVFATEVNGRSYERLTLHGIRNATQPGDRILCAQSSLVALRRMLTGMHTIMTSLTASNRIFDAALSASRR